MLAAATVATLALLGGIGSNVYRGEELKKEAKQLDVQSMRQRLEQLHLNAKERELATREAALGIDTEASTHRTPASLGSGQ
jgi:hypothetical protein